MYVNYPGLPDNPVVVISDPLVHLDISNFNLSMKCMPEKSDLKYVWEKKGGNLPTSAQGINSSQVTVTNVRPEDSGDYRCIVSNSTGKLSSLFSSLTIEGV